MKALLAIQLSQYETNVMCFIALQLISMQLIGLLCVLWC